MSTCVSLYCCNIKQIGEDLNDLEQQAKVTLPTGNHRALPPKRQKTENRKKMTKARLGLMPVFLVYPTTRTFIF